MGVSKAASTFLFIACFHTMVAPAVEPTLTRRSPEPSRVGGPAITLHGIVLSPTGEPLAGATIALRVKSRGGGYTSGVPHDRDVLATARSGDGGRFEFDSVPIPPRFAEQISDLMLGRGGAQLVAWAEGSGLAWSDVAQLHSAKAIALNVAAEADVHGTLRDEAGKGIPDLEVGIFGLTRETTEYDFAFRALSDLRLSTSELAFGGRSDAEGRFVIPHLPQGYRAVAIADNPGRKREVFMIDTERDNDFDQTQSRGGGRSIHEVLRTPIELVLPTERFIQVNVSDHQGRRVTSGTVVVATGNRVYSEAVNRDGTARLKIGSPGRHRFQYGSDPLAPTVNVTMEADVPGEGPSSTVEIRLPESRQLAGRVADASTGAAVAGVHVGWRAGFEAGEKPAPWSVAISGANGEFRLPVLPGKGRLRVEQKVHGYLAPNYPLRQPKGSGLFIEVPEIGEPQFVEVKLSRGLVVRGTVRSRAGEPVAGATVVGENLAEPFTKTVTVSDAQGRYELGGLSPHVEAQITVTHASQGAEIIVPGEADHSWSQDRLVELNLLLEDRVTLAGRILRSGKPAEGVRVKLMRSVLNNANQYRLFSELLSDAQGRYSIGGLSPGDRYHFEIETFDGATAVDWTHQSPYIQSIPANAKGTIQIPDARLVGRTQVLGGLVVDREGNPVAGIRVSAQLAGGGHITSSSRTAPSYTETNEEGRFNLRQLPEEPIELMAYRANPRGGPILYPARVRPAMNQEDIRILLDPTLLQELEDLDKQ